MGWPIRRLRSLPKPSNGRRSDANSGRHTGIRYGGASEGCHRGCLGVPGGVFLQEGDSKKVRQRWDPSVVHNQRAKHYHVLIFHCISAYVSVYNRDKSFSRLITSLILLREPHPGLPLRKYPRLYEKRKACYTFPMSGAREELYFCYVVDDLDAFRRSVPPWVYSGILIFYMHHLVRERRLPLFKWFKKLFSKPSSGESTSVQDVAQEKPGMITRTCKKCGKTITLPENVQYWPTYCQECRAKYQLIEPVTRKCRGCGKDFTFPSNEQPWPRYCRECQEKRR